MRPGKSDVFLNVPYSASYEKILVALSFQAGVSNSPGRASAA